MSTTDRLMALQLAFDTEPPQATSTELFAAAERIMEWASPGSPAAIRITAGPVTVQGAVTPPEVPVQIHDNEQFDISLEAVDSKGVPVPDTFTTTVDNAAVVTLVPSADGSTVTIKGGTPGSAVVTVSDGTRTATEAVDVIPGAIAKISITEGPVTVQP